MYRRNPGRYAEKETRLFARKEISVSTQAGIAAEGVQNETCSNCEFICVPTWTLRLLMFIQKWTVRTMCPPIKHTTSYLYRAGVNTRKSAEKQVKSQPPF